MKKIIFTFATLLCTLSMNAQIVKLYNGNTIVKIYDKTEVNKVEFAKDRDCVDLGLSVKWATCNVGADNPEDYGDYFAWGETTGYNSGKTTFNWSTYTLCGGSNSTMTKYSTSSSYGAVDNKTTLDLEDDAAYANWGGSWRMPTDAEWTELRTNCTWTWTTRNNVKGYKVTGTNGNSIFLPAAGYHYEAELRSVGFFGYYWSSSLSSSLSYNAYDLCISSNSWSKYGDYRYYGYSVRPVCK